MQRVFAQVGERNDGVGHRRFLQRSKCRDALARPLFVRGDHFGRRPVFALLHGNLGGHFGLSRIAAIDGVGGSDLLKRGRHVLRHVLHPPAVAT